MLFDRVQCGSGPITRAVFLSLISWLAFSSVLAHTLFLDVFIRLGYGVPLHVMVSGRQVSDVSWTRSPADVIIWWRFANSSRASTAVGIMRSHPRRVVFFLFRCFASGSRVMFYDFTRFAVGRGPASMMGVLVLECFVRFFGAHGVK